MLLKILGGRFDGMVRVHQNTWDFAAGVLIVQKAGGKVTDFGGNITKPKVSDIIATNSHIHEELLRTMKR